MLLYIIRHGDPNYKLDCLTERGKLQAQAVGKRIAASKIGSTSVTATFFIFLALFTALLIAELSILFRQIKIGPEQEKE